jgi:hypothetical protein
MCERAPWKESKFILHGIMPQGRPRIYSDETERLEARRAKVRLNVQAFRRREKDKERAAHEAPTTSSILSIIDRRNHGGRALAGRSIMPFGARNPGYTPSQPTRFDFFGNASDKTACCNADSRPSKFPLGKSLEPVSQVDFIIGALQRRYVPDDPISTALCYLPNAGIGQFCSTWISYGAISNTPGASLLRSVLFASALSTVGLETHDTRLLASGFQAQTRAVQKLRNALDSLAAGKTLLDTKMLAITILFCASDELIINKSWENFWKHLQGVGALIQRGGPSNLICSSARDVFYGYRAIQITFCLTQRKASFLAQPEWIDRGWNMDNALSNGRMQTMLDIAYQIPTEMQDYDESCSKSPEDLRNRIQRLRGLALQLDKWKVDMDLTCIAAPCLFKAATWPAFFTEAIDFEDLTVAMPFTTWCGVRVHLFDLIRQIAEDLSQYDKCHDSAQLIVQAAISECLKWSRTACQCMEFFQAQKGKFKIVGRLVSLFSFDAAWDTFSRFSRTYSIDLEREVFWCRNTARRYDACGLPVLCWR